MAKHTFTEEDDALLDALGVEVETKKAAHRTPREERIIAGFEEIERFVEQQGRLPQHGEDNDIFERLYAVRLDRIRASAECKKILEGLDTKGLLDGETALTESLADDLDDEALLSALGVQADSESDITTLTHVKTRTEKRAAEDIAQRIPCQDFERFRPLFTRVQEDLASGIRKIRRFQKDAAIEKGEFFILGGQVTYVAEMGKKIKAPNGETDARLRVIYDNGTESNLLRRSLQRALYKDEAGRRITDPSAGPLFSDEEQDDDIESGTIYVLRSKSEHPEIKQNYKVLHKIGVTSGSIEKRIADARNDPTFLMADVEVVATYKLSNINRVKLENLIHKFFAPARLNIEIKDRFGKPIVPREWFLVPLFVIDKVVEKIKENKLLEYKYNFSSASLERR